MCLSDKLIRLCLCSFSSHFIRFNGEHVYVINKKRVWWSFKSKKKSKRRLTCCYTNFFLLSLSLSTADLHTHKLFFFISDFVFRIRLENKPKCFGRIKNTDAMFCFCFSFSFSRLCCDLESNTSKASLPWKAGKHCVCLQNFDMHACACSCRCRCTLWCVYLCVLLALW